jgi:small subunit ribosomal protein S16
MLAIRLRRTGAKKDAHYRIVVTERSAGRDGRFLEILGHYHPRRQPMEVTFNFDRTDLWIGKGAQMSDTVRSLYRMATGGTVPTEEAAPQPELAPVAAEETELETAAQAEASEDGVGETETETEVQTEGEETGADTEGESAGDDDVAGEQK